MGVIHAFAHRAHDLLLLIECGTERDGGEYIKNSPIVSTALPRDRIELMTSGLRIQSSAANHYTVAALIKGTLIPLSKKIAKKSGNYLFAKEAANQCSHELQALSAHQRCAANSYTKEGYIK